MEGPMQPLPQTSASREPHASPLPTPPLPREDGWYEAPASGSALGSSPSSAALWNKLLDELAAHPERRVEFLQKLLGEPACRQLGIYQLPAGFKLSVVIPVYNEERWLAELVRRVQAVDIPKELIIVNDCSTDRTPEILAQIEQQYDNVRVIHQPKNMGKGAALREGFRHCTGDVVIVQDADWEYNPAEYPKLIQPIVDGRADVVYGSRFIGESHRVLYYWHSVANKILTTLSNWFTNLNLTDMETCYKVFRREVIQSIRLRSNRFGFEPEVTAKIARRRKGQPPWRVYEVPISYSGRTYEEGKKIGLKDAFQALYCIIRYWLAD
jgi:glycosyltransferase involved in cell wall biosynthesis